MSMELSCEFDGKAACKVASKVLMVAQAAMFLFGILGLTDVIDIDEGGAVAMVVLAPLLCACTGIGEYKCSGNFLFFKKKEESDHSYDTNHHDIEMPPEPVSEPEPPPKKVKQQTGPNFDNIKLDVKFRPFGGLLG